LKSDVSSFEKVGDGSAIRLLFPDSHLINGHLPVSQILTAVNHQVYRVLKQREFRGI
jgi:hypothetical protein